MYIYICVCMYIFVLDIHRSSLRVMGLVLKIEICMLCYNCHYQLFICDSLFWIGKTIIV